MRRHVWNHRGSPTPATDRLVEEARHADRERLRDADAVRDADVAPKNDRADGKPRLELVAPDFLFELGQVLAYGARKYRAWSWVAGKEWTRDLAAAQRHLAAWLDREDLDPESGLNHLAHAATDIMIVLVSQLRGVGTDDRPEFPARPAKRTRSTRRREP